MQYSIEEENGRYYVQADRNVLRGTNAERWGKQIENYINLCRKKLEKFLDDESFSLKGRAATHIGEDGFRYYEAYFRDIDGENYKVRFSAGLNGQEETVYSIGKIEKRRSSIPGVGSSSQREALKVDQRPSGLIMRTSGGKVKKKNPPYKLLLKKRCKRKTGRSSPNGTRKRTIQHRYSRIPNCQIHRNVVK